MNKDVRNIILLAAAALLMTFAAIVTLQKSPQQTAEEAAEPETETELAAPYAERLFDRAVVHTIDVQVPEEEWNAMIGGASEKSKEYIVCDMVIDGERLENVAIRCKGHSSLSRSRSTGKYSFKVEFDHFAEGVSYYGLDKLSLNNLVADSSCMHDYIVYRMMGRFGVAAPLCSYAFVTVNGQDFGLYLAVEAVEDAFLARNYGEDTGDLYKPDRTTGGMRNGNGSRASGRDDTKLQYVDDDPESYPNIFGTAKTDVTRKDQYRLIEALRRLSEVEELDAALEIEQVIHYFVVHSFVYNWDAYTGSSFHNYYLHEKDGRLSMIPWDYNEAFGSGGTGVNYPIDTPVTSGTVEERPMLAWMFADPAYTALYHDAYAAFLDDFIDSGWAAEEIAAVRSLIGPYVQRDPRSFVTYESFEKAADSLAVYFDLRGQSVRGQLDGSIPSTSEGQAADRSAMIDTSTLGGSGSGSGYGRSSRSRQDASGETGEGNDRAQSRETREENDRSASRETGERNDRQASREAGENSGRSASGEEGPQ